MGERVPILQDIIVGKDGKPDPKVRYEDVGVRISLYGRWIDPNAPTMAALTLDMDYSAIGSSSVTIASGVTLPVFTQRKFTQGVTVGEGVPFWLACSDAPLNGQDARGTLALMRITVNRVQ